MGDNNNAFSYVGEVGIWTGMWALSTASLQSSYSTWTPLVAAASPIFTFLLTRYVRFPFRFGRLSAFVQKPVHLHLGFWRATSRGMLSLLFGLDL